jgi:hypothetical protein
MLVHWGALVPLMASIRLIVFRIAKHVWEKFWSWLSLLIGGIG